MALLNIYLKNHLKWTHLECECWCWWRGPWVHLNASGGTSENHCSQCVYWILQVSSNAPCSFNLDSKGKFPSAARHPEATGMVSAVLELPVMDVLHSTSYRLLSHLTMGYPQDLPYSPCCHWERRYTIQYIQSRTDPLPSHPATVMQALQHTEKVSNIASLTVI